MKSGKRHWRKQIICQIQSDAVQKDSEVWQRLVQLKKSGAVFKGTVQEVTNIGVFVDVYGLKGLVPLRELIENKSDNLVGKNVQVRLMEVDQSRKRIVLSEKGAQLKQLCEEFKVGDIVQGTVTFLESYGAFVALKDKKGNQTSCQALVHISQLSWEKVSLPDQVVQVGQEISAKIIQIDLQSLRVALSLRELDRDPLTMTIDSVIPLGELSGSDIEWEEGGEDYTNPGVQDIVDSLQSEEGIEFISLARQASSSKAVSQDLQVFMAKEEASNGYNLVARAGNWVQEIHVATQQTREEFKATLQRALNRL